MGSPNFSDLKSDENFPESSSSLEQTASHAYTLYFSKFLIIRAERSKQIMDLGQEE